MHSLGKYINAHIQDQCLINAFLFNHKKITKTLFFFSFIYLYTHTCSSQLFVVELKPTTPRWFQKQITRAILISVTLNQDLTIVLHYHRALT